MAKVILMTGKTISAGFKTKKSFLAALSEATDGGFTEGKRMTKKNNTIDILVTNDPNSTTNKMVLAEELGVDIMTYEDMVETFELEGDL
jgi:hypothetical protein